MPLDFYVLCQNPGCPSPEEPIPLLIANVEQGSNDPKAWPNDGSVRHLACPACRLVSVHFQADRCFRSERSRNTPEAWIGITLVCGEENPPRSPFRFLALVRKLGRKAVSDEVEQKVRTGYWLGTLPTCGHPFSMASHIVLDYLGFD